MVALSIVLVADRSGGVSALIVCALYYYYIGDKRKKKKNTIVLIGVGVVLAIVSSAVASIRSGKSSQSGISLLFTALEEMGFNFTSLCFVMDYIPLRTSYRLGVLHFSVDSFNSEVAWTVGGVSEASIILGRDMALECKQFIL